LEVAKYGLNPSWHLIYCKSTSGESFHKRELLRLRHLGSRVAEGQTGYVAPEYLNEDWEILGTRHLDSLYDAWYDGVPMLGRGVYRPDSGIVYDNSRRVLGSYNYYWEAGEYVDIDCWDNGFYTLRETTYVDNQVPSPVMGFTPAWPGTLNSINGAFYQDMESWPVRRPLFFHPDNHTDTQPWSQDSNMQQYSQMWMMPDSSDGYGGMSYKWVSNFFYTVHPFFLRYVMDENNEPVPYPDFSLPYAIYQGPTHWRTLSAQSATYQNEPSELENSMWDWAWDGSCAESNMQIAYVRRKSDGSIWRFRNWKPTGDVYTDFPNLTMRPIQPAPNTEYASFFMNGPPIPGNETWNTLMILK
jgi:hypothetical protein